MREITCTWFPSRVQRLKREFILNHVNLHFTSPSSEKLFLNLSVQPSTHLSTHASTCPSTNSWIQPSTHLSIHSSIHSSIHYISFYIPIHPSMDLSIRTHTHSPTHVSILCPFTCLCCVFRLIVHYQHSPAIQL